MKTSKVLNSVILILLVLSLAAPVGSAQAGPVHEPDSVGKYVPGEVIVGFKAGMSALAMQASASELSGKTHTSTAKMGKQGIALLRGEKTADVNALVETLKADPNIAFAEPNYIFTLPVEEAQVSENYIQKEMVVREQRDKDGSPLKSLVVPISQLQGMKKVSGGKTFAIYPNDPYLWWNSGYDVVDADIVSSNPTASAGVCVLDTGVDYTHPDLSGRAFSGYDFVNGDSNAMDDHGHGTHVAGIITAKPNNSIGMAGASNARVVAVKVLGAQGWGTSYDIAMGINHCANRSDVKVLSMSLGGPKSDAIMNAIAYAVIDKGKLLVAAAGNSNTDIETYAYPAYFSNTVAYPQFANKVISVAASGQVVSYVDNGVTYSYTTYGCKASYSNYGDWVSVVAPGTDIYSTTPYDKPFYMNYFDSLSTRYEYLSGTSMATPFVAAAAARRWGYKPTELNYQVGSDVVNSGWYVDADGTCWPTSMASKRQVNIANLLDRFAVEASVADASTGLGLTGAQVLAYRSGALVGSSIITPNNWGSRTMVIANSLKVVDTFYYYTAYTTIINLPAPVMTAYTFKAYKAGYTATPQYVFWHSWYSYGGGSATVSIMDRAGIPPQSSNIDVVTGYVMGLDRYSYSANEDLDGMVWLPATPNSIDVTQQSPFIVGEYGNSFGYVEDEPAGNMNVFPYARLKREGGAMDYVPVEDITISSRKAHGAMAGNAALPYYPGSYVVGFWDTGHTYFKGGAYYPTMGTISVPYVYIWKDGVVKLFNQMALQESGGTCNTHYWKAATITSGAGGVTTYSTNNVCSDSDNIFPY